MYYSCTCSLGYTGFYCSIPICTSQCNYNGTCSASKKCTCLRGKIWADIELDCGCVGHGACNSDQTWYGYVVNQFVSDTFDSFRVISSNKLTNNELDPLILMLFCQRWVISSVKSKTTSISKSPLSVIWCCLSPFCLHIWRPSFVSLTISSASHSPFRKVRNPVYTGLWYWVLCFIAQYCERGLQLSLSSLALSSPNWSHPTASPFSSQSHFSLCTLPAWKIILAALPPLLPFFAAITTINYRK